MDNEEGMTWSLLVKLEPRLGQLQLDCRFADRREPAGFNPDLKWNGADGNPGLKQRLDRLVGPHAEVRDERLVTPQAYELACVMCYQALPPSRSGY